MLLLLPSCRSTLQALIQLGLCSNLHCSHLWPWLCQDVWLPLEIWEEGLRFCSRGFDELPRAPGAQRVRAASPDRGEDSSRMLLLALEESLSFLPAFRLQTFTLCHWTPLHPPLLQLHCPSPFHPSPQWVQTAPHTAARTLRVQPSCPAGPFLRNQSSDHSTHNCSFPRPT